MSRITNLYDASIWAARNHAEITYGKGENLFATNQVSWLTKEAKFYFTVPKTHKVEPFQDACSYLKVKNLTVWTYISEIENRLLRLVSKAIYCFFFVGIPGDWLLGQLSKNYQVISYYNNKGINH